MSKSFTPGPWTLITEGLRGGKYWSVIRGSDDLDAIDIHEDDNGEADARLVASAPELYEALACLLRHNERQFIGWPVSLGEVEARNRTVAVLAKARGEKP